MKVDTTAVFYTVRGRRVYGGGGIIPDVFVPLDTTKATTFFINCNKKATQMRFAQSMFDRYGKTLAGIDDFDRLDRYMDEIDVAAQFLDYASRVDGLKPKEGEWEETAPYLMPQLKALVGRFSKLSDEAFYRFYVPIDDTIQAALKNPSVVE
jgi:carboxyl-terminal processing protease